MGERRRREKNTDKESKETRINKTCLDERNWKKFVSRGWEEAENGEGACCVDGTGPGTSERESGCGVGSPRAHGHAMMPATSQR